MQLVEKIGIKHLEAYGDLKLIINQVNREYEVWYEDLVSYNNATINIAEKFRSFYINHVPRQQNAHVDALASFAASLPLPAGARESTIHSHDLYFLKFALEDSQTAERKLQVNEIF